MLGVGYFFNSCEPRRPLENSQTTRYLATAAVCVPEPEGEMYFLKTLNLIAGHEEIRLGLIKQ